MASNDVRIRASVDDKVSGNLDRIRDKFDHLGKSAGFKSLVQGVGVGVGIKAFGLLEGAASKATDFAGESIEAASQLQQSMGAIDSVFGKSAGIVTKFGETAADSFGLSKREVNEFGAVLGAQLTGVGFSSDHAARQVVNLQKRAADMAATFGGPTSAALEAIGSLMRGERDPIEKYGVTLKDADIKARILSKGLDTTTTAAEKESVAIASLELLMEQTAKTTGRFAAESDELAGAQSRATAQMENSQAVLGQKMLPAQIAVTNAQIDAFTAINALADGFSGKLTPETIAAAAAVGLMTEAQAAAAIATLKSKEAAAEAATAYTAYEGKRGLWISASKEIGNALPNALEAANTAAKDIVARTPADIATALREGRSEWRGAVAQLQSDIENPLTRAAEFAEIKAELAGDNIKKGLKSKDPVIRAQANATRQMLLARLEAMGGDYAKWGKKSAALYAAGIRSGIIAVQKAARLLATAQRLILEEGSPAKEGPLSEGGGHEGWGRKGGELYAKGLGAGVPKAALAAKAIAAASRPIGGALAAPGAVSGGLGAISGAGRDIVVHTHLHLDGREIAETVDRHQYYMQSPGGILPRR